MVEIIMLSVCAWCLNKSDTVLMRRVSAMLKDVDELPMAKPVCNYSLGDTPRLRALL